MPRPSFRVASMLVVSALGLAGCTKEGPAGPPGPPGPPGATGAAGAYTATADRGVLIVGDDIGLRACPAGQVLKSTAAGWSCEDDVAGEVTAGDGLAANGSTLSVQPCAAGEVLKHDGTGWTCAADATGAGTLSGAGAAGQLALWTGASSVGANADLTWSGTGLGINVSAAAPLHVRSSTSPTARFESVGTEEAAIRLGNAATGLWDVGVPGSGGGVTSSSRGQVPPGSLYLHRTNALHAAVVVNSAGAVGISTPVVPSGTRLQIQGDSSTSASGTLWTNAGGTTVTGVGAQFLSEVEVGDMLVTSGSTCGAAERVVTAITNNTTLTISEPFPAELTSCSYLVRRAALRVQGNGGVSIGGGSAFRRMDYGTIGTCTSALGASSGTQQFNGRFFSNPVITLTPMAGVSGATCTTVRLTARSTTSFNWESFSGSILAPCACIMWTAMGS